MPTNSLLPLGSLKPRKTRRKATPEPSTDVQVSTPQQPADKGTRGYSSKTDVDILADARAHMALVSIMESEVRDEGKRCQRFRVLKQWDDAVVEARGPRPTLVIDQLMQYQDQVMNDWRRNRVGVKTSPADGPADAETARILDGWIRQIEYQSKAHISYDWAFECMSGINRGFFKLTTRRRKGTFKQDPWILKIDNPDCVYMDPFCRESDYSDQRRSLITDRYSISAFKDEFGKTASIQDFEGYQNNAEYIGWITKEAVTVAEWWVVEEKARKIQRLIKPISIIRNNRTVQTDIVYDTEYNELPEGVEVRVGPDGERMEDDEPERIVWQYMVNGVEVLDKTRWLGSYIPLIPMIGKELYYDGKRYLHSVLSRSLDAQRLFNYAKSSMAERLGQFPKNPVVALVGQIKTDEAHWANMNSTLYSYLNYDPVTLADGSIHTTAPQRADYDPHLDQHVLTAQTAKDDIKGTIGMYGPSLGDREGKARSGVAERTLQQEGDNATFNFPDNGGRAVELCGKMLVDLAPNVLSQPDIIQIRDTQNKTLQIAINQDIKTMANPPKDQKQNYDLTQGQYQVTVSAAPSHETLRKEGAEMSMEILKMLPPDQAVKVAPVMLRLQDWYGATEIADILDPPKPEGGLDPQIQAQMQKAQQIVDMQTKEIDRLGHLIETQAVQNASKEKIAAGQMEVDKLKIEATVKIAQLNLLAKGVQTHEQLTSDENMAMTQHELDLEAQSLAHSNAMEAQTTAQDSQLQQQQAQQPEQTGAAQ